MLTRVLQHKYLFCLLGLTAVETWVVSCIIHVFGVLAEYALILKMIQVMNMSSFHHYSKFQYHYQNMKRKEADEKKREQKEARRRIEEASR